MELLGIARRKIESLRRLERLSTRNVAAVPQTFAGGDSNPGATWGASSKNLACGPRLRERTPPDIRDPVRRCRAGSSRSADADAIGGGSERPEGAPPSSVSSSPTAAPPQRETTRP